MNTDAPWPGLDEARSRVLEIQAKLHQWATDSPDRRFGDLFNLVCDPAFLTVGWDRVRGNRGARTAGVDGVKPRAVATKDGEEFLRELRDDLKARRFAPQPVRQRMIPKASGKLRRLGIPTARDRVVQASLKLVLEPIFEADFKPCSYGFRPKRRAQDAIEEIRHFARLSYEWVLEGDIASCFDEILHPGLRTPQGGILSPLLANIALSVLDEHFAETWQTSMAGTEDRRRRRRHGEPMYRLVRYADDFVVLVSGTQAQAEALKVDVAAVLSTIGLRLSQEKTEVCHIDEGFVFLGFRIQRQVKPGSNKRFVYSWPSKSALASIVARIKAITKQGTNQPLSDLLRQINAALRGWTVYFHHGASKRTFSYLGRFAWLRVVGWLQRKHRRATWKTIRRRYLATSAGLVPHDGGIELFDAGAVAVTRYRYRGTRIPNPWTGRPTTTKATR